MSVGFDSTQVLSQFSYVFEATVCKAKARRSQGACQKVLRQRPTNFVLADEDSHWGEWDMECLITTSRS